MKKQLYSLIFILSLFISGYCQSSHIVENGVAVFYPPNFEPSRTLPSLVFVNDLENNGNIPSNWKITPEFSIENGNATVKITYPNDVDLYGNGQVTGSLRRNGTDVTLWNSDNYAYGAYDGKQLYQSHPWVMGIRADGSAFGIIADNTWKQHFNLTNPIVITSEGPAFRVIVIEKENPQEVLKTLSSLTGTMEMPPLWAIGYQQCRYSYFPDTRVKEIANEFRNRKIPCDVIWMDIDYMDGFRVFTFDNTRFPDPKGLNDYLHGIDFKSVYMIDPGIKKDENYFVYQAGTAGNHWVLDKNRNEYNGSVWPGVCAFPDYTRPETQAWWRSLYQDFMATGIDGVWNDMNEPAVFNTEGLTMPIDNIHRGGGELPEDVHLRYHNIYGLLMVRSSREGILEANPSKRPFVLSRANFLGGHRYAATWTGDNASTWDHLRLSVPMSLTLGLSGQPFNGPDIGGFSQNANADLLGHWMALGAYYPFSRNHASSETTNQEPWAFGAKIEDVSRTAVNRRYRLLPYFYTLFREASQTGLPVMRPLFMADVTDANLRNQEEVFLLGGDLMIIPRWATNYTLPKGDWDILKLEDNDDGYQPFVALREGAIVPINKVIQSTEAYRTDSITLLINPKADGTASGYLYDDAGNGFDYKTGEYSVCKFYSIKHDENNLKIDISKVEGNRDADRYYRIGYVTDNEIVYSEWSKDLTRYVKMIADTQDGININQLTNIYLGGTFNNWSLASAPLKRDNDNETEWISEPIKIEAGSHELKFANQFNWWGDDWGNASGLSGVASKTTNGGANIKIEINETGNYIVKFDSQSLKYSIERTYDSEESKMYISGTLNNWANYKGKMVLTANNTWKINLIYIETGNHIMKFANSEDWSGNDWGNASGLTGIAKLSTGGDPFLSFSIVENGYYTITFNDKTLAYSIVKEDTQIVENDYSQQITVSPNPSSDYIYINGATDRTPKHLYDMNGRLLFTTTGNKINITEYKSAVLILKVQGKSFKIVKK